MGKRANLIQAVPITAGVYLNERIAPYTNQYNRDSDNEALGALSVLLPRVFHPRPGALKTPRCQERPAKGQEVGREKVWGMTFSCKIVFFFLLCVYLDSSRGWNGSDAIYRLM
ncbi:unnamed protein product [Tuber melanosporum]|uniref:(Perigord truffle) hypothetical protein n=1 Tax=Tuber melanosporum (strain Mel28) TaxID=656061 RepID=D5GEM2_TUBMM|nr:uncharacterized protein GSTUM_00006559001 [Tuber melanosporum]CAZ82965.1 unnamed protein product [Tuber melanosporum]